MVNRKIMDRFLTPSEEKQLFSCVRQFSAIEARRDYAWMLLLRSTAIRVKTLAGLTVSDAKEALNQKHLLVRSDINKGGASHKVFLGKNGEKALLLLLKIRKEMGYPETYDDRLIMSREHNPMSIRAFQNRCQHWGNLVGLAGLSPHWFRHTLAMRIMQESSAQDPRGSVMATLGHRSINSTAIYTQPDKHSLQRIMREVG